MVMGFERDDLGLLTDVTCSVCSRGARSSEMVPWRTPEGLEPPRQPPPRAYWLLCPECAEKLHERVNTALRVYAGYSDEERETIASDFARDALWGEESDALLGTEGLQWIARFDARIANDASEQQGET